MLKETSLKYKYFLKSSLNLLQYCFCFTHTHTHTYIYILAVKPVGPYLPDQGSNCLTLCIGRQNLNHWTTREVLKR